MERRVIIWDFDGTLAHRPGGWWAQCMLEWLEEVEPGHGVSLDDIRPYLKRGFPWHEHDKGHPDLCDPEAWWAHVGDVLGGILTSAGIAEATAATVARMFPARFPDPTRWVLYDDTLGALERLRDAGWRHAILSNNLPELPLITDGLGLGEIVDQVFTSAVIGYEKPHPEAFRVALDSLGPNAQTWMVGDNAVADVAGAERLGISAILVRSDPTDEGYRKYLEESFGWGEWSDWSSYLRRAARDLEEAAEIIISSD